MHFNGLIKTFALAILVSGIMSAAPVSCPAPPPPAQVVDMDPPSGPSGYTFSCGGLTFSNFEAMDAGATNPVVVTLVNALFDPTAGIVYLNFNPNLVVTPSSVPPVQDIHFFFNVTGPVNGIDLAVGGTNSTITERACATAIDRVAANNCTGGLANQLAVLTNFSGDSAVDASFPTVTNVSIFKDINVRGLDGRGAELTSFSQSFHTSAVPEPMSMMLMGSGLAAIAVLRRKRIV